MAVKMKIDLDHLIWLHSYALAASRAARWIKDCQRGNAARERSRRITLQLLGALGSPEDIIPMMNSWITTTAVVLTLTYAYDAAVKVIQDKYFDPF
jgi:hypothetical protein